MNRRVLFVCTANVDRSRTAQNFFNEQFSEIQFTSAGTDEAETHKAGTQFLTQELLDKADTVIVMEDRHKQWIASNLLVDSNKINVLNIPDKYRYYSLELLEELQRKCAPLF